MKWLPTLALVALHSASSPAWEVSGTGELGNLPGGGFVRRTELSDNGVSAQLTAIVFPSKSYSLRVVDSNSPGHTKLASALSETGCVAGVNGSYFKADFRPVGLMVSDGRKIHPFEQAKLLAGVLAVRGTRLEIVRSSKFAKSSDLRQAIQCGPLLVEGGHAATGLNADRSARRTIVATDGHGRWALVYLTSVTLADAARILTTPGALGDWVPATALNLD
ncbi:MAG: phosphodiester glycosidase family protein, partial [Terrimicrobiaceae bacterium]|nr:phosphodiester glycosidase family protein [Terrimicrobiaceae bacterium]